MILFYKLKRLDVFKEGVSLPGLVLKYFMKSTDGQFYLFDEKDIITTETLKGIIYLFLNYI
jgi:hypothetical protein